MKSMSNGLSAKICVVVLLFAFILFPAMPSISMAAEATDSQETGAVDDVVASGAAGDGASTGLSPWAISGIAAGVVAIVAVAASSSSGGGSSSTSHHSDR